MIHCVYVGNLASQIGDREFEAIGQRADFSEQGFYEAVTGGAAFIPAADFDKLEFTEKEIEDYGNSGMRIDPSPSFLEKVERAQQIFRDLQRQIRFTEGGSLTAFSEAEAVGS